MSCRVRVAPALLAHVNLLLAVVCGASIVTAARLKWDPSTYVPLRQLFPQEYRVAGVMLCAGAVALLLLLLLATVALALRPTSKHRRRMLIVYAVSMSVVGCVEVAWGAWTATRAAAWLRSPEAQHLTQLMELHNQLRPVLNFFGKLHPLPHRVNDLIEEVEADVPCNVHVAIAMVVSLGALQAAGVLLAALAASAKPRPRYTRDAQRRNSLSFASVSNDDVTSDKAPLKAVYRKGRLVMV